MSYAYDAVGNRTQRTDYNGTVTTYVYDNLNRLKTITYPTRTVTYAYTSASQLSRATNENGSVFFGYDNRYRLSSVTDPFNYAVSYSYNTAGNRTRLSLNGATYATYTYDTVNRLTNLADSSNQSFPHAYDEVNRLTSRTAPNGVTSSYVYDGINRLSSLTHAAGATTLISNQYQYNDANNIANWANASGNHAYNYDTVNRLTSATSNGQPSENYAYDSVGDRASSHLSASYQYQPFNKLTNTASASYTYDNNGNLTSKTDGTGITTYTWNEENQLKQVSLPNGLIINYKYDALGRRIQRTTSSGANERYVYDGSDVLIDLNANGSIATTYLNDLGIDTHLRQTNSTTGVSYYLTDHQGSTAGLTDSSGNIVEQLSYDSFGNSTASSRTRYSYTGREWDGDAALYYYRARFYDPQMGRFISEDPVGFGGGINFYAYVGSNSVNATDPQGLYESDVHFYLTYYLAMKTGCFSAAEARVIADGDQDSDDNPSKAPGPGLKLSRIGDQPALVPDVNQQIRNRDYHAFGTHEQNAARITQLWQEATSGRGNPFALGTYLHFVQDSYSHYDYAGNLTIGQFTGGFSPDHTNVNLKRAMNMARETWDALMQYAKAKKGCNCAEMTDADWNTVRRFAEAGYDRSTTVGWLQDRFTETGEGLLLYKIQILGVPVR